MNQSFINEKNSTQSMIDTIESYLASTPSMNVRLSTSHGHPQYYLTSPENKHGKYVPIKEIDQIKPIIQREYYVSILPFLKAHLYKLDHYYNFDLFPTLNHLYEKLPEGRKKLITPIIPPDSVFIENWYLSHPGNQNTYQNDSDQLTDLNEPVRSKSETAIANKLQKMNIPYVCEPKLILKNGHTKYPDYMALNLRTRQTFIWEHLGLSDLNDYNFKNLTKLALYEKNGYYVGQNVILTFETKDIQLNKTIIEAKIQQYLL